MEIYCDGLTEPNPGIGTWAFVCFTDGKQGYFESGVLSNEVTNNRSEYEAVWQAVEYIKHQGITEPVRLLTDSQLVVKQVTGAWQCHKADLTLLREQIWNELVRLPNVTLEWIPGKENEADVFTRQAYETETGIWPEPHPSAKRPPTEKQTAFLDSLGYKGPKPKTIKEASKLIARRAPAPLTGNYKNFPF